MVNMSMRRRDFLANAATAALVGSATGRAMQRATKRERLACNSWPFRAYFDTPSMPGYRDAKFPLLTQAQFPEFLADHFEIHNVEFLPQHFVATEASTIDKIKAGLKKAHSRCCNLMGVEFAGGVFNPSANLESLKKEAESWADVAVALGSPSITVALNGDSAPDAHVAARNLTPVVETAQRHGIKCCSTTMTCGENRRRF